MSYIKVQKMEIPGYKKLITTFKKEFYWPKMKNETSKYVERCLEFHKFKTSDQHLIGLLKP